MGCADTESSDTACPVGLVDRLRDDDLRRSRTGRGRRCPCPAVMNDSCDPREQRLVVDLANDEAIFCAVLRSSKQADVGQRD